MSKKRFSMIAPLLAFAALAVVPVAAEAVPHWYSNKVLIPQGVQVPIVSWGTLTLTSSAGNVTCRTSGNGTIENPVGGGSGLAWTSNLAHSAYECGSPACPAIMSIGEPNEEPFDAGDRANDADEGQSELVGTGGKVGFRAQTKGIEFTARCLVDGDGETKEEVLAETTFAGELSPKIISSGSVKKPTRVEFGAGSGELLSKEVGAGKVTGALKILGYEEQEAITVK